MDFRKTVLGCLITIWPASSTALNAQSPVNRVVVTKAKEIEARPTIVLVGTVQAARRSRVGARISGIVVDMPTREGDQIEAGALICKLRDDSRKLRLAAELAKLERLRAAHAELVAGTRSEELRRLRALYDASAAEHDRWKFEMARIEKLFAARDSNQKEYQDTLADFTAAQRSKIAAESAYNLGKEGPRSETIAQAMHAVAEQEAVVGQLRVDLDKTRILAPFSGFVVARLVEVGEWLQEGGAVVDVVDLSTVLVRIDVPESALASMSVGDAVRVKIDALHQTFDAKIKHVLRQADVRARTFPVDVEIDNPQGRLAGGMFARVTVPSGPAQRVIAIPKDAIVEKKGVTYVGVVVPGDNGTINGILMPITVGIVVDAWIAVTSDNLRPDTTVITRGVERMMPFPTPIEIVDERGTPIVSPIVPSSMEKGEGA